MNNSRLLRWWRRLGVTAPPAGAVLVTMHITLDDGTRHDYLYLTPHDRFTYAMGLLVESVAEDLHLDEREAP